LDTRAKELIKRAGWMFDKKRPLMTLWQEIAENFYPERADFTTNRTLGEDFGANLISGYPCLVRRDLGDSISGMLRPNGKDWFHINVSQDSGLDTRGRQWLEHKERILRRAMYDRAAQFVRATKQADHDFATFGQAAISKELSRDRSHLIYKTHHLRDMAWCESDEGRIEEIAREWHPTARDLVNRFPNSVSRKVKEKHDKDPYCRIPCYHFVIPNEYYDTQSARGSDADKKRRFRTPFVSVYIDRDNGEILAEEGSWTKIYSIPRWQTVSGSQYAHSPATTVALADARTLQAISLVLLEAGQKSVDPPMIATSDVVRSDIQIYAGGVTWLDRDYDERAGEGLRPINQDFRGIPLGFDMREDVKAMIKEAFYINKLSMPPVEGGRDMTAYEVGQRVQEYIRHALPLFEPMEMDYNGDVCDDSFELLLRAGAFGSVYDMPQSLRGQEIVFRFESPLHDAADRQKSHSFAEARQMLALAAEMDPAARHVIDPIKALRDTLKGIRTPAEWIRSEDEAAEIAQAENAAAAEAAAMQQMEQGGRAARDIGQAAASLSDAEMI